MNIISNKVYEYEELSQYIACDIRKNSQKIIGITGTSCVGKSTFTKLVKEKLGANYIVQVIGVDSYLKETYRGGVKFWTGTDTKEFLKPVHFDWKRLKWDTDQLQQGQTIEKQYYIRGIGWNNIKRLEPADIIIVEGLFLDSVQAAEWMDYDLVISLVAQDDLIRKLRMDRDDYYRNHYENFTRTKNETLRETESTLRAGKAYQKCREKWNYMQLLVEEGFKATIEK